MPFEEKVTWVSAIVSVIVAVVYGCMTLGRLGSISIAEIAYQKPMLISICAMIAMTIVGTVVMSIGTAVSAEIKCKGSAQDIDRSDERDVSIGRRGDLAGHYVSSVGMLGALSLALLEQEHFWIANAIFLSFVLASLVSSVVKIAAYRRGF